MNIEKYRSCNFSLTEDFPFSIGQVHHDSTNVPAAHSHEFIELVYVVEGSAEHVFEGKSYPIKTNDVFIINPGEVHTFKVESGKHLEIINCLFLSSLISDSLLKELGISQSIDFFYIHPFLNNEERFHHFVNLDGNYSAQFLSILEGMIDEYERGKTSYSTLIRLRLIELLIILSRIYNESKLTIKHSDASESKVLVQRICGYLARNYNQKISIPDICKLFNISSRHLSRIFKLETGQTIIEMVHHLRIEKAKTLLLMGDTKIIEIALTVGYDDQAFFSRLFSRIVGCSPGKYKENESLRFSQNNKQTYI